MICINIHSYSYLVEYRHTRIIMAVILKIICAIVLIGMVHSWNFPFHDSMNNNSTSFSIFNDINKMMAMMNQRFQRLFGLSSFPMDNWLEDREKLDAIEPICTTTTNPAPISISKERIRRKKFRPTKITTCTKELIQNGKKQFYKEMNITDDKGVLISQSKIYQTIVMNPTNDTTPIDQNVISY